MVEELTNKNFENFVKEGLTVVDFFADWCMPCLMMAPILEEIEEKFKGQVKIGKVDVGDNQSLASKFSVNSIPNFVIFREGKVVDQFVGGMSMEEFEEKISQIIK